MEDSYKYMVFRYHNGKDGTDERAIFYGWTHSKVVLKAFFKQRDKEKYRVIKMYDEDIAEKFSEDNTDDENKIDFIKLKSASSGDEIYFFMTHRELLDAEIMIQRYFSDLCSLSELPDGNYINMFINLNDYYKDALYYIGYRPQEIDVLFPSADDMDNYNNIEYVEEQISDAYTQFYAFDARPDVHAPFGGSVFDDDFRKVLYSLENFVRVLKNDM